MSAIGPQITEVDLLFTCYYICKCKVNVNGPSVSRFTLHLQGLVLARLPIEQARIHAYLGTVKLRAPWFASA
jgi:hypothetical protein